MATGRPKGANTVLLFAACALVALGGCSSADPTAEYPDYVSSASVTGDTTLPVGPRNNGVYLSINDEPLPSLDQLTEAERQALTLQMRQLDRDLQTGRITTARYNERLAFLRSLAKNHAPDMISQIERDAARDRAVTAN